MKRKKNSLLNFCSSVSCRSKESLTSLSRITSILSSAESRQRKQEIDFIRSASIGVDDFLTDKDLIAIDSGSIDRIPEKNFRRGIDGHRRKTFFDFIIMI